MLWPLASTLMGGFDCAVHSLVELYALQYELNEPADTEGSLAVPLLEDAFSSPEMLIASFGKAKQPFTPDCGALHEQSNSISKAKDSPAQVLLLWIVIHSYCKHICDDKCRTGCHCVTHMLNMRFSHSCVQIYCCVSMCWAYVCLQSHGYSDT